MWEPDADDSANSLRNHVDACVAPGNVLAYGAHGFFSPLPLGPLRAPRPPTLRKGGDWSRQPARRALANPPRGEPRLLVDLAHGPCSQPAALLCLGAKPLRISCGHGGGFEVSYRSGRRTRLPSFVVPTRLDLRAQHRTLGQRQPELLAVG
jgi:hypothetical protein